MTTTTTFSRFKACRRIGIPLWPWRHFTEKQTEHLAKLAKRNLDTEYYGTAEKKKKRSQRFHQIRAKQLVGYMHGRLKDRYLCTLFQKCGQYRGFTASNFLIFLEKRLDSTLFRVQFAPTIASTKQLISHGKILVNQKVVTQPGYFLRSGDVVSVIPNVHAFLSKRISTFLQSKATLEAVHWKPTYKYAFEEKPHSYFSRRLKGDYDYLKPLKKTRTSFKNYISKKNKEAALPKEVPIPVPTKVFHKPSNLEVNYSLLMFVFLGPSQQLHYPAYLSLDDVAKAYDR
jgi:ribosomal protein S4